MKIRVWRFRQHLGCFIAVSPSAAFIIKQDYKKRPGIPEIRGVKEINMNLRRGEMPLWTTEEWLLPESRSFARFSWFSTRKRPLYRRVTLISCCVKTENSEQFFDKEEMAQIHIKILRCHSGWIFEFMYWTKFLILISGRIRRAMTDTSFLFRKRDLLQIKG
jgi:hypothetical protein